MSMKLLVLLISLFFGLCFSFPLTDTSLDNQITIDLDFCVDGGVFSGDFPFMGASRSNITISGYFDIILDAPGLSVCEYSLPEIINSLNLTFRFEKLEQSNYPVIAPYFNDWDVQNRNNKCKIKIFFILFSNSLL